MFWNLLSALGGVGLFLVGMLMLTNSLRALAGRGLRNVLARFTSTPLSGAITGAFTTAAIQSSSATTVTAVGFVASGLLTFPQALGVVFGANIGTTLTGWLVALLGFKLDLGQVLLPVVFFGALLMLSERKRVSFLGQALAGFSLIFIGVEQMKVGLEAFEGIVTPTDFPSDTVFGKLKLVAIGVLITLVTQSSSAGVATALAALSAGALSFPQAAALVIGMDVGTTFTAVLATLGGGVLARRTGFAHVIYNLMTGVMAFFLLGPFAFAASYWIESGSSLTALVAFHSFFNLLGVILILPFARPFARLIELLVPDRGASLTRSLDEIVLRDPVAATEAAKHAVFAVATATTRNLRRILGSSDESDPPPGRQSIEIALSETRSYLDRIEVADKATPQMAEIQSMYHALDHLGRLLYRCTQTERISELDKDLRLKRLTKVLLMATGRYDTPPDPLRCEQVLDRVRTKLQQQRLVQRDRLISAAADGSLSGETVWIRLDALRWLHRVAYHLWRVRKHLNALTIDAAWVKDAPSDGAPR